MNIKDYKDLKIWQKEIELVKEAYEITDKFPTREIDGLSSQIRRAAISIPSNIAEDFVRKHPKEYSHFLSIALGSCAELDTQLIIAEKMHYINAEILQKFSTELNYEMRMISTLITKIS